MKGPYPECEFCECTNEGSETLGCAAEKLRKAGAELMAALPLLRRLLPEDGFDCKHFAISVYARRKERMIELSALTDRSFAMRCCEMIRAERNPYGYEYEMKLWDFILDCAKEGLEWSEIIRRLNWKRHVELVLED